jgi:hypothetical protein
LTSFPLIGGRGGSRQSKADARLYTGLSELDPLGRRPCSRFRVDAGAWSEARETLAADE